MCGICGVVRTANARPVAESTLMAMRDSLRHRGPDGAGVFQDDWASLGHRRLSIVDVTHGHQPMHSDDGRFVIVYNGEVFNHPELQPRLESEGVKYRTRSDTETILHLFQRHGVRTAEQLRGMFAIAIWDRRDRRLWLARDRFGVKPLYYVHDRAGALWFGSEIKALIAAGAVTPTLNASQLPDYLANHAPSGNETLFEGVQRLPAGHTLVWEEGRISLEPFWELSFRPQENGRRVVPATDRHLVGEYAERLTEAVRLRLMADVPLGAFLSGGIDSAAITAIMAGLLDAPVKTFSVAFAEREANELSYARMVADRFRTDHHEVLVTPDAFWQALPSLVWHEDEPIAHPSSIALFMVARLASEHVKVVLTGEGSDETLAGYNRYRVTVFNSRLGRAYAQLFPSGVRGLVERSLRLLPATSRARERAQRTFLMRGTDLDDLYFDNFAVFGRSAQHDLLSPSFAERVRSADPYAAYHQALARTDAVSLLDRLLYADIKTYLQELLMKQDQMSMAASVESRVPFLDHPLVEWVSRLPQRMKLRGTTTKWILRQAMQERLPTAILERGKMGFPVPAGRWLRHEWRFLVDEYLLGDRARARGILNPVSVERLVAEHVSGQRNHADRLWALVNLEVWQRVYLDGEGRDMTMIPPSHLRRAA